tara:strand:+ start:31816 stop:32718 length:903 start_codon:yes stop_codon:yes gene_type:complete
MFKFRYILVDDSVAGVGGTAFTLEGILEPVKDLVLSIPTRELSLTDVVKHSDKIWIFGNIHGISVESFNVIISAMERVRFFKVEFDYGYCSFRGRIPHKEWTGESCNCSKSSQSFMLRSIYELIKEKSIHNFYMSQEQLDFHAIDTHMPSSKCSVLSSCFSENFFSLISEIKVLQKNGKYAIIDGQGGWHSKAKGVKESISYATNNNISYDILKTESHEELMRQLCHYTGLIFLPIIHDTCPRITIESKLLGLDLIINEKCQHITEEWWSETLEGMEEYLSGRPAYMWDSINNALSNNTS